MAERKHNGISLTEWGLIAALVAVFIILTITALMPTGS